MGGSAIGRGGDWGEKVENEKNSILSGAVFFVLFYNSYIWYESKK